MDGTSVDGRRDGFGTFNRPINLWRMSPKVNAMAMSTVKPNTKPRNLPYAVLIRFTRYWMVLCVGLF